MQSQDQLACRARSQLVGASFLEVDDDAGGGMRLAVHANAHTLDARRANRNAGLSGGHYGLRQIHYHASG